MPSTTRVARTSGDRQRCPAGRLQQTWCCGGRHWCRRSDKTAPLTAISLVANKIFNGNEALRFLSFARLEQRHTLTPQNNQLSYQYNRRKARGEQGGATASALGLAGHWTGMRLCSGSGTRQPFEHQTCAVAYPVHTYARADVQCDSWHFQHCDGAS